MSDDLISYERAKASGNKTREKSDMMRSNSFPFVLAPLRGSFCLFWRETHTKH